MYFLVLCLSVDATVPPKPIPRFGRKKKTFIAENAAVATAAMFDLCPPSYPPVPLRSLKIYSYPFWKTKSVNHLSVGTHLQECFFDGYMTDTA